MFELDGESLTLEDLQVFAKDNNIDFDTYMTNMKNAGMVEKTNGSTEATPTGEPSVMESELDDGSSVLLDRIEAGDFGEEPEVEEEKEEVEPSKFNNFFKEIIPAEADVTNIPMVNANIDKLTVEEDYERVDDFTSDENLQKLNDNYKENGVTFNKFRKNTKKRN